MPGPREPKLTPYAIPPSRAGAAGQASIIVLACGAQMGKTEFLLDLIGERLDNRPAPILYVGPSQQFVREQFEPRVMEMLDQCDGLRWKTGNAKLQTKTRKLVAGVPLRLAHGGSSSALKSDPASFAMIDEYDEMLANVRGQGSPLGLVQARGDTYADFFTVVTSTPSVGTVETEIDPASGLEFWKVADTETLESQIWELWQSGTRFHWTWACPHCGHRFVPRFKCLQIPKGTTPAEARRKAFVLCPSGNGCVIEEKHKAAMNAAGVYVAPGQYFDDKGRVQGDPPDSSTWSYWVSGLCSPFVTFGERAERYQTALNTRDPDKIQTAVNAGFGETYGAGGGDALGADEVQARRANYLRNHAPAAAVRMTLAIDVQRDRLIYGFRGWGEGEASWLVDFGEIYGDTAQTRVWKEAEELLHTSFDGLRLNRCFVDSGFRPGDPKSVDMNRVYEFCLDRAPLVYATKGYLKQTLPMMLSKIEVTPTGKRSKYGLDLIKLHTDHWKKKVFDFVRRDTDDQGAWFIPDDIEDEYCEQVASESRAIDALGRPQWRRMRTDNHALDIEAMNCAAAYMLRVQHLRKVKPRQIASKEGQSVGKAIAAAASTVRANSAIANMARALNGGGLKR